MLYVTLPTGRGPYPSLVLGHGNQLIASETYTQTSSYKRTNSNLQVDEKGVHHLGRYLSVVT